VRGERPIPDPLAAIALSITWVMIALAGWGFALFIQFFGDSFCERGDSNYGDMRWSLLPPGPVCKWTEQRNGFAASDGPGPLTSVWLVVLLVLGFLAVRSIKRLYAPDSRQQDGPGSGTTLDA